MVCTERSSGNFSPCTILNPHPHPRESFCLPVRDEIISFSILYSQKSWYIWSPWLPLPAFVSASRSLLSLQPPQPRRMSMLPHTKGTGMCKQFKQPLPWFLWTMSSLLLPRCSNLSIFHARHRELRYWEDNQELVTGRRLHSVIKLALNRSSCWRWSGDSEKYHGHTEWVEVLRVTGRGAKFLGWRVHRATAINTALLICTVTQVPSTTTLCPFYVSLR